MSADRPSPRLLASHLRPYLYPILEHLQDLKEAGDLPPGEPLQVEAGIGAFQAELRICRVPIQVALPKMEAESPPLPNSLTPLQARLLKHVTDRAQTKEQIIRAAGLNPNTWNKKRITELVELGRIQKLGNSQYRLPVVKKSG